MGGDGGVIPRLSAVEKRVSDLDAIKSKIIGGALVVSAAAGIAIQWLKEQLFGKS